MTFLRELPYNLRLYLCGRANPEASVGSRPSAKVCRTLSSIVMKVFVTIDGAVMLRGPVKPGERKPWLRIMARRREAKDGRSRAQKS